jgi:tRNA uridine 5-carboxymethylaminomethyl modification enzyme
MAGSYEELRGLTVEEQLTIETDIKYEGYIRRQDELRERLRGQERERIPGEMDYTAVPGLSRESAQRMQSVRPETLGQAARMPGITPAAVAALAIELARRRGNKSGAEDDRKQA